MLIGCCLNLLAEGDDRIGINRIEMIAGLGYDYVDLPIVPMMALSDEEFDALCERVKRAGIPCRSCCNLFPADVRVTGENVDYDKLRTYLEKATSRVRKLGVSVIVFGSPAARDVIGDFPREIAMVQFIKALQIMDEYADENLHFAIEHVGHWEGNLVYTVEEAAMIHSVCRTKYIDILADTYHMAAQNEPYENLVLAGDHLVHMHLANPNGRIYPAPNDGVDYKKMFSVLKSMGYTGGISIEAFAKNPEEDARVALQVLREALATA